VKTAENRYAYYTSPSVVPYIRFHAKLRCKRGVYTLYWISTIQAGFTAFLRLGFAGRRGLGQP